LIEVDFCRPRPDFRHLATDVLQPALTEAADALEKAIHLCADTSHVGLLSDIHAAS